MADREKGEGGSSREKGEREGFGDDAGTRIGSPDPGRARENFAGPSSAPDDEGLEGSILSDEGETRRGTESARTGAGSEAAEGMHAVGGRDQTEKSAVENAADRQGDGDEGARSGSEPLEGRKTEHRGSYGGEGGEPRVSSDQREPNQRP